MVRNYVKIDTEHVELQLKEQLHHFNWSQSFFLGTGSNNQMPYSTLSFMKLHPASQVHGIAADRINLHRGALDWKGPQFFQIQTFESGKNYTIKMVSASQSNCIIFILA